MTFVMDTQELPYVFSSCLEIAVRYSPLSHSFASVVHQGDGSRVDLIGDTDRGAFSQPQSLALAPGVGVIFLLRAAGAMSIGHDRIFVEMRTTSTSESQALLVGTSVTLTVVVTGASGAQTYRWAREDGHPLFNASDAPVCTFTPSAEDQVVGTVVIACTVTDALARVSVSRSVGVQPWVAPASASPTGTALVTGRVARLSLAQGHLILIVVGCVGFIIMLAAVAPFARARRRLRAPTDNFGRGPESFSGISVDPVLASSCSSLSGVSDVAVVSANFADGLGSSSSIVDRLFPSRRLGSRSTGTGLLSRADNYTLTVGDSMSHMMLA